jgi:hypothetical protein
VGCNNVAGHNALIATIMNYLDWVAQSSVKFQCQLKLKCQLISCTFQEILKANIVECLD